MNDIKGLEVWEGETRKFNRAAGRLKMKAGIGMIDALENWYSAWKTKHTERNKREFLTWRLRLHLRFNSEPEFLEELDEYFEIGLHDDEIGPTMWDIKPEKQLTMRSGFNWRRDSGGALRGGKTASTVVQTDLEESSEGGVSLGSDPSGAI